MLGGKIEINQFQNHIDHTYPVGHWVNAEWQRIKNDIVEALKPSHNSAMVPCNQYMKQSSTISVCPIGHFNCGASPCMVAQHYSAKR